MTVAVDSLGRSTSQLELLRATHIELIQRSEQPSKWELVRLVDRTAKAAGLLEPRLINTLLGAGR